jgi:chaperonin cofactor prefoldin
MPSPIKNETMSWILKIGGFIMSITIMLSSWFLNQAMTRISNIEVAVKSLELNNATSVGNKFTNTDWANAKTILDNERNSIDRRIVRLEENSIVIKDALLEIKQILKESR